jgi:hypothetical protein
MNSSYNVQFDGNTKGRNSWKFVCEYLYTPTLKKSRWVKPDGTKTFTWQHKKNISDVKWENGVGGQPILLYNQFALESAKKEDKINLVEGEKDVDTLTKHGRFAVCSPHGAGKDKWDSAFNEVFRGRNVVVVPDNDRIGRETGQAIALSLHAVAKSVKVIDLTAEWEDLKEHGDITDVFEMMGKSSEIFDTLDKLVDNTAEFKPDKTQAHSTDNEGERTQKSLRIMSAPELHRAELPPTEYLIDKFLPVGTSILGGSPKGGKSWFVYYAGLMIARGEPFLERKTTQAGVLYLSFEDKFIRLQERMFKLLDNSPPPPWFYVSTEIVTLEDGLLDLLDGTIKQHPEIKLVIIDIFQKIRGAGERSERWYERDYRQAGMVKEFADKKGISVFIVTHTNKFSDKTDPFNELTGTTGISGAMDTMFVLKRPRGSKEATLYMTGRDVEDDELLICLNDETCQWELIGTAEDIAEQEALDNYQTSFIPKTIKAVLDESVDKRWTGSAKNLLEAGERIYKVPLASSSQNLSKQLAKMKDLLYEQDRIVYTISPNGNAGNWHHFRCTPEEDEEDNTDEVPEF